MEKRIGAGEGSMTKLRTLKTTTDEVRYARVLFCLAALL